MRILLTGGSGFLGRQVVSQLAARPDVETIFLVSRRDEGKFPEKVRLVRADLSQELRFPEEVEAVDAVIHLAASYDFNTSPELDYVNNVIATQNLIGWIHARVTPRALIPVIAASSYSVGIGNEDDAWCERPLERLPSRRHSYARTKAMAERLLLASGLPVRLMRLGVLVGNSSTGEVEKLDGPYPMMKFLSEFTRSHPLRFVLPRLPLPGDPAGVLPLVPVDVAARAFCHCLEKSPQLGKSAIFGVYNQESVAIGAFVRAVLAHLGSRLRPVFLRSVPEGMLEFQQRLTKVNPENFAFALTPPPLANPNYGKVFDTCPVPSFEAFRHNFFAGFDRYMGT